MVEFYVDDIAVKSRDKNNYLRDLKIVFDIMRAYQLKINPTKSFLGVFKWQVSGIHCHFERNHLDPDKVKDIHSMQPLKNLKEPKGLQGRLAYI